MTFALSLLAVGLGVALQIPNAANLEGYNRELLTKGLPADVGHLLVRPVAGGLAAAQALTRSVGEVPCIEAAVVRRTHAALLVKAGHPTAVLLVGASPLAACEDLAEGTCPTHARELVLGAELSQELGLVGGDWVKLVAPSQQPLEAPEIRSLRFRVTGIRRGHGGFGTDRDVFLDATALEDVAGQAGEAAHVAARVADPFAVEACVPAVSEVAGDARITTWSAEHGFLARSLEASRRISALSVVMVVIAVMVPVLALLYIQVLREAKTIAVLAALGFSRRDLFVVQMLRACLVGAGGLLPGVALGYGLCLYFTANPVFSHQDFVVAPVLRLSTFLVPSAVLFGVTLLAGLLPALRARGADPASALRME